MNGCAYITKITEIQNHPNADKLNIGLCLGESVIISKDVVEGELGIYFPADSQIGRKFAEANNLIRRKENGKNVGGYLPESCHVRAMKLRGVKSEGLWLKLESLSSFCDTTSLHDGDEVNVINETEICRKYIPVGSQPKVFTKVETVKSKVKYPYFLRHIDTEYLCRNLEEVQPTDKIIVTEKLHGTSGRTAYTYYEEPKRSILKWVLNWFGIKYRPVKKGLRYVTGTRNCIVTEAYSGYSGREQYRRDAAQKFVGKLQPGEEVFYEIVGYDDLNRPIMGEYSTEKTDDSELIQKYGKRMVFDYGCSVGQFDVYVYRMLRTDKNGIIHEYTTEDCIKRCQEMSVKFVPIIASFTACSEKALMSSVRIWSRDSEDANRLFPSRLSSKHIAEGIVVRLEPRDHFVAYKHKSFLFKMLEGSSKEQGQLDPEEAQSLME